jgi:hypothetical protein
MGPGFQSRVRDHAPRPWSIGGRGLGRVGHFLLIERIQGTEFTYSACTVPPSIGALHGVYPMDGLQCLDRAKDRSVLGILPSTGLGCHLPWRIPARSPITDSGKLLGLYRARPDDLGNSCCRAHLHLALGGSFQLPVQQRTSFRSSQATRNATRCPERKPRLPAGAARCDPIGSHKTVRELRRIPQRNFGFFASVPRSARGRVWPPPAAGRGSRPGAIGRRASFSPLGTSEVLRPSSSDVPCAVVRRVGFCTAAHGTSRRQRSTVSREQTDDSFAKSGRLDTVRTFSHSPQQVA